MTSQSSLSIGALNLEEVPGGNVLRKLDDNVLEAILLLITDPPDRAACSLTCRTFMQAERNTRQTLQLRCTRGMLHRIPRCFQAVTDLDISRVIPRGQRPVLVSTTLAHLAKGFPQVETLTMYTDFALAEEGLAPLIRAWPNLQSVVIRNPHPRCLEGRKYSDVWESVTAKGAYSDMVSGGPLVLKWKLGSPPQPLPGGLLNFLRHCYFRCIDLRMLLGLNPPDLVSLGVDLWYCDENVDLLSKFTGLQYLRISDDNPVRLGVEENSRAWGVLSDSNFGRLVNRLSKLKTLEVTLRPSPRMTEFVVTPHLAASLRNLVIRLVPTGYAPDGNCFSLSSIAACSALERLTLGGSLDLFRHFEALVDISASCRRLVALNLPNLTRRPDETHLESGGADLFRAMAAEGATLTELRASRLPACDSSFPEGQTGHLLDTFTPLSTRLKKLTCIIQQACPVLSVSGWHGLEHLNLIWGVDSVEIPRIEIDCPSLRVLELRAAPRVRLAFSPDTCAVTSFTFTPRGSSANPFDGDTLALLLDGLSAAFPALSDVSLSGGACQGDYRPPNRSDEKLWQDELVLEALAQFPSLRRLSLNARPRAVVLRGTVRAWGGLRRVNLGQGLNPKRHRHSLAIHCGWQKVVQVIRTGRPLRCFR
ncbi:hypothetical protein KFL_000150170 [Klebsormidium nitens]|uniref:COI1 F-box domain-containing protein n=1 Tax=Klebsormidium nitens TaxID=105231 RepID=A0A1Y1HJ73_KLENI|nr:hypothetical protein KFL_000150170 [Klebsormidium nitens]|eukprot:GAQ78565.1 hypothetical protein KFL_000150170 [Klebsormidium nitens]